MNKRIDLARQTLRLLPSKSNPRVKRWQAPDEAAPTPRRPRGKADLSRFVLDPDEISSDDIEMVLDNDISWIHGTSNSEDEYDDDGYNVMGDYLTGKFIGDYLTGKHILGVAERMAKETERIKEFLENSDNPRLQDALARTQVQSVWELPIDPGTWGSCVLAGQGAASMLLDPVCEALHEQRPDLVPIAGWISERGYAPELVPWHEAAHVVDLLQSKRFFKYGPDLPSTIHLKNVIDSFGAKPYDERMERLEALPRLRYPLHSPEEWFSVLSETEITNPQEINRLERWLGVGIRDELKNLHGNTLPYRPWQGGSKTRRKL